MGSFIVDEDTTLKNFTDTHHAQASFYFTALLKAKEIKVNGKKVSADMPLSVGDTVQYFLTEKQLAKKAFHVVYEDEQVILVEKESGVNSEAVFAALSREQTAYFVHRLDRNTQGLLVFGKTEEDLIQPTVTAFYPFKKIYSKENPCQACALMLGILLSAVKIFDRILFDIGYGAPKDFGEVLVMIVYYSSDILLGVIFYVFSMFVFHRLFRRFSSCK